MFCRVIRHLLTHNAPLRYRQAGASWHVVGVELDVPAQGLRITTGGGSVLSRRGECLSSESFSVGSVNLVPSWLERGLL